MDSTKPQLLQLLSLHMTIEHVALSTARCNKTLFAGDSFSVLHSDDKTFVSVQAEGLQTNETVAIVSDLLVEADGCLSSIRETFLLDLKVTERP
ncbi:hypothetical protein AAHA92_32455 [Salvia divinorum]|uniref:Uncharacterized protein n=1 Tax=Salvia divinorum TaxID=28513 RepID=A0ABD1FLR2_SALDI